MTKRRLTRGRMRPWACGHRGFGAFCHRCAQANELETRANALVQAIKTRAKELPEFVQTIPEGFVIRAGGERIVATIGNTTQDTAISKAIGTMREHATRLSKREDGF